MKTDSGGIFARESHPVFLRGVAGVFLLTVVKFGQYGSADSGCSLSADPLLRGFCEYNGCIWFLNRIVREADSRYRLPAGLFPVTLPGPVPAQA